MPYLKIEFIPQFTMEALLKKATHRYEDHILQETITIDLMNTWKRCEIKTHFSISQQTYWMIRGSMKDLIKPWSTSILKMLTRGTIMTTPTKEIDSIPVFKLEINKLIALINSKDINDNIKSIDGDVWDLTSPEVITIIRGKPIVKNLYTNNNKYSKYKKGSFL